MEVLDDADDHALAPCPGKWRPDRIGKPQCPDGGFIEDVGTCGVGRDVSGETAPGHDGNRGASFRYADGTVLVHGGRGVTFQGERGQVSLHGLTGSVSYQPKELEQEADAAARAAVNKNTGNEGNVQNFLDCVRSRRKPNADVDIGCRTVTVCHLGNICYWLQRPLKWNPTT